MSGAQFVRIETFARTVSKVRKSNERASAEKEQAQDRKLTVEEICAEAGRTPGSSPHVENPQPPSLVFGVAPEQVPSMIEEQVRENNKLLRGVRARSRAEGKGEEGLRATRSDTHVLVAMVASFPIAWKDEATEKSNFDDPDNKALLEEWTERNLVWGQAFCHASGLELVSVVEHFDEKNPHLHFLAIPKPTAENRRMEALLCHPGHAAKARVDLPEGHPSRGRALTRAYKEAMRAFQDEYHDKAGRPSGLLRTGPKRTRKTRAQHLSDLAAAKRRGLSEIEAKKLESNIATSKLELAEVEAASAKAVEEAGDARASAVLLKAEEAGTREALTSLQIETDRQSTIGLLIQHEVEAAKKEEADLKNSVEAAKAEEAALKGNLEAERRALEQIRLELKDLREAMKLEEAKRQAAKEAATKEQSKRENALKDRERELERKVREIDAVSDGIAAYAKGLITYQAAKETRLSYGGLDEDQQSRFVAVRDRLEPLIKAFETNIQSRLSHVAKVIVQAIDGWGKGILLGVGDKRHGRPTFYLREGREGDDLLATIEPHREHVAAVVEGLPDRGTVARMKLALAKLGGRIDADLVQDAKEFEEVHSLLTQRKIQNDQKTRG